MVSNFRDKAVAAVFHLIDALRLFQQFALRLRDLIAPVVAVVLIRQPRLQRDKRLARVRQQLHAVELVAVEVADVDVKEADLRMLENPF